MTDTELARLNAQTRRHERVERYLRPMRRFGRRLALGLVVASVFLLVLAVGMGVGWVSVAGLVVLAFVGWAN